ncbi:MULTISPECIES: hypothetical protein [Flavobacterium]|jgi:ribosomal 30S subunit maturation factor RimM|uniref:hypothetical protein n=1 Tax=Flavobacterium TaxID=237 RepID=UPI000AEDF276|nr:MULTISPECIES: hypothetical protein [Flavobacterium]MDQ7959247.1 hypothetical protein [Flavobacterium lindanitolerans]THD33161.1 MAG: hypothetical protein DI588_04285 [Flavobacterium johnsoniae]
MMRKYLIILFVIVFTESFSQINKEKVVIIFDSSKDGFKDGIFAIDNQTFVYNKKKKKKEEKFELIKDDVCTIEDLNSMVAKKTKTKREKKPEFYYSEFFDISIYIRDKENFGQLYPVERVWLVEKLIKD